MTPDEIIAWCVLIALLTRLAGGNPGLPARGRSLYREPHAELEGWRADRMSERETMVQRVATVLVRLEMLAEGVTSAGFEATPIHGGQDDEPGGKRPPGGRGALDYHLAKLAKWCETAEEAIQTETGRVARPAPEDAQQFRARIIEEHEGRHYEEAAGIENVSRAYIRKIREAAGRDPLRGRLGSGKR